MQNIKINIHGFRFIEIETGNVAKPNRTAINRVPFSALILTILTTYCIDCDSIVYIDYVHYTVKTFLKG